eukprot:11444193-Alexandrium_andersonii.AAC.1
MTQIRPPEAPREARRLQRPPLKSGAPILFSDSEPRRGPFVPLGELGPRPPREGLGQIIKL